MEKEQNFRADLVGVFGHPVSENPTILMQEAAFKELGLNWRYLTIEVFERDLEDAMKGLRAFNMRGINLTIPHKVEVIKYLDKVAPDAELIGAVNTVIREGNELIGENTDGKGFLHSLKKDAGIEPAGKRVVVFGTGGASRAICVELALAGVVKITVVNRTEGRGKELTDLLNKKTPTAADFVHWVGDYIIPEGTDVVVNATSIGLYPDINAKPAVYYDSVTESMTVCDVIPNPPNTLFLKEAGSRGAKTLDGLGMLVYQGMIGFRMWTGKEAPEKVMKVALKQAFGL